MFGDEFIAPASEDVELIFGVRGGRKPVIPGGGIVLITGFLNRCFPGKVEHGRTETNQSHYKLSPSLCRKVLNLMVKRGDTVRADDVARVLHFYLMSTFFTPNMNLSLNWRLTELLDGFGSISKYDWCTYILEKLMDDINSSRECKIGSCTVFLLVSS